MCRIYDALQTLRRYPGSGKSGTKEGTRELVIAKSACIAAYRVTCDAVEILHVWEASRPAAKTAPRETTYTVVA